MGLVERITAKSRQGRKSWVEPPFWAVDHLRFPLLSVFPLQQDREQIENDFEGYVRGAYKANGIVFACIAARQAVFAQARFQWRERRNGVLGDPFGTPELALLERPWPGGTTGELLARAEVDVSLAGNSWWTVADDHGRFGRAATGPGRRLVHLRPDWVTMVLGSNSGNPNALDTKVVGILYQPRTTGGARAEADEVLLTPEEVAHYSPLPDPEARFRGMSWLTPVLREIQADKAATLHKAKFFEHAAVPNLAIKFDKDTSEDAFNEFVERFRSQHQGAWNAYKTLFLAGGADVTPLTMDFRQLDFKATQGTGETRIAAAARVHPVILGISEGLQGSALNAGNYAQARRNFAEGTLQWLWNVAAASFQRLVPPPRPNVELWADTRDIPFLREDRAAVAEIQQKQAVTIRQLVEAGYEPDAVVRAVMAEDWSLLTHTGVFSVQLQPPQAGTLNGQAAPAATPNGSA